LQWRQKTKAVNGSMFDVWLQAPVAAAPFGRIGPRHQGRHIIAFGLEFGLPQEQDAPLSLDASHVAATSWRFQKLRISSGGGHRDYTSTSVKRDWRVGNTPPLLNDRPA
jgi:hypothetical protein